MSLATTVATVFEKYAERPAIGMRASSIVQNASQEWVLQWNDYYETISYAKLWERSSHAGSALHYHPHAPLGAGDVMAILSFTSADYATLDIACIRLGVTTVPMQTGISLAGLVAILNETMPAVLASSIEHLDIAISSIASTPSIRRLIILDAQERISDHAEAIKKACGALLKNSNCVDVSTFHNILETGERLPEAVLDDRPNSADELAMLIYTSGSTGLPKGAMYTQRLAAGMWGGSWASIFSEEHAHTFHYMPMSHVAGHSSLKSTLARGGICFFTATSNLSTLMEDISLAKPTELSLVPRICEMFYQKYQSEIAQNGATDGDSRSQEILEKMRLHDIGGRVAWASCSSAPLSPKLKHFTERLLGIPLHNVYGSTEAGVIWIDNKLLKPPVEDYRLVDVPELGYYSTDRPYPRGELRLKTSAIISGYYQNLELSADMFDREGFYRTGDIVAQHRPSELHFVDRRTNVVKLSQGEFVALARLETLFTGIAELENIFVHARSEWSYPLAVIVPTSRLRKRFGNNTDLIRAHLHKAIRTTAKNAKLRSFEIPRDFVIAHERFTQKNGLLSDHGKPLWALLRERYAEELDTLHEQIQTLYMLQLKDLYRLAMDRSTLDVVLDAAHAILAPPKERINSTEQFRDLGGDSLSAVTMSSLLSEVFNVSVPVDIIISPAYDLQDLANHIDSKLSSGVARTSSVDIHGKNATVFHAADLGLNKFLAPQLIEQFPSITQPNKKPKTVFLTGATGFLGRFLCLNILEQIQEQGGKLVCLVRGKNHNAAATRLLDALGGQHSRLGSRLLTLGESHLEVVAGDFSEANLGLDVPTWARLSKEVGVIIHAGALVNHLLSYDSLFDANVNSTAELIGLALSHHRKSIIFMSSVAVSTLMGPMPPHPLDEDCDIRQWASTISAHDTYAAGYGLSKWASEVLLREAHEQFGLPVTVYRSSMILAHSHESGQLNLPDMFTRLILSIAATGLAPRSFYREDASPLDAKPHYDGLPVDFTAAAIVKTGLLRTSIEYCSFNLVNHHDDGVSLDTFVHWMRDSGLAIRSIEGYDEWLTRFEQGLRNLPEHERAGSILPLIHGLSTQQDIQPGAPVASEKFRAALALGTTRPLEVPKIDKALIRRYIDDLQRLGLIQIQQTPLQ